MVWFKRKGIPLTSEFIEKYKKTLNFIKSESDIYTEVKILLGKEIDDYTNQIKPTESRRAQTQKIWGEYLKILETTELIIKGFNSSTINKEKLKELKVDDEINFLTHVQNDCKNINEVLIRLKIAQKFEVEKDLQKRTDDLKLLVELTKTRNKDVLKKDLDKMSRMLNIEEIKSI